MDGIKNISNNNDPYPGRDGLSATNERINEEAAKKQEKQSASAGSDRYLPSGSEETSDYSKGLQKKLKPDGLFRNTGEEEESKPGEKTSQDEDKQANAAGTGNELSPEQEKEVRELKKIDRETRAHEQAHMSAGAGLTTGGPTYSYQKGPDGRQYAVGGEVHIDLSAEEDTQATIRKMQQAKRAALAPADPSPQDRQAAARASQIESQARSRQLKENSDSSSFNSREEQAKVATDADTDKNLKSDKLIDAYNPETENKGENYDNISSVAGYARLAGDK